MHQRCLPDAECDATLAAADQHWFVLFVTLCAAMYRTAPEACSHTVPYLTHNTVP